MKDIAQSKSDTFAFNRKFSNMVYFESNTALVP